MSAKQKLAKPPSSAAPPLSIGVVVGGTGTDARSWGDAAMALGRRITTLRQVVRSPISVNVVYVVPGDVLLVNFSGVRTGQFDSRRRLLSMQAALPTVIALNPEQVLLGLLDSAISEAEGFALRKGLADRPLTELRTLVHEPREPS